MDKVTNYVGQPIFNQILSLIDDGLIASSCKKFKSNFRSKKLKFKDHLTTMLYSGFSRCHSLREVQLGLELCQGKLNHLGLHKVPARSTLSDGNKNRDSAVFGELYTKLYAKYKNIMSDSQTKTAVADKLYILDSTTFSLFKAILKPAGRKRSDGKSKGGIKAHMLLKADSNMPSFIKFSAAATHDQTFYDNINELPDGSYITFDKAYINYEQFEKMTDRGVFFVVPQKVNAQYTSIKEFPLIDSEQEILKDELIQISYQQKIEEATIDRTQLLRRIAYYSEQHKTTFVYWTNNYDLPAMDIVLIYRNRWQIEQFFKRLKQNFPLEYFLGDNENAIKIQIWCSLIGLILLQVIFKENTATLAFSNLCTIICLHLMTYVSITEVIELYKQKRKRPQTKPNHEPVQKNTTQPPIQSKLAF
jgi:transposase